MLRIVVGAGSDSARSKDADYAGASRAETVVKVCMSVEIPLNPTGSEVRCARDENHVSVKHLDDTRLCARADSLYPQRMKAPALYPEYVRRSVVRSRRAPTTMPCPALFASSPPNRTVKASLSSVTSSFSQSR